MAFFSVSVWCPARILFVYNKHHLSKQSMSMTGFIHLRRMVWCNGLFYQYESLCWSCVELMHVYCYSPYKLHGIYFGNFCVHFKFMLFFIKDKQTFKSTRILLKVIAMSILHVVIKCTYTYILQIFFFQRPWVAFCSNYFSACI